MDKELSNFSQAKVSGYHLVTDDPNRSLLAQAAIWIVALLVLLQRTYSDLFGSAVRCVSSNI